MEWRNVVSGKEAFMKKFCGARSVIVFDTETTGLWKISKNY